MEEGKEEGEEAPSPRAPAAADGPLCTLPWHVKEQGEEKEGEAADGGEAKEGEEEPKEEAVAGHVEEEGEVQGEENGEAINPTLLWTFSPRPAPLARWSDGAQAQASLSAVSESSSPSNKSCKTATSFLNLRLA
jgi:hypothetical protein